MRSKRYIIVLALEHHVSNKTLQLKDGTVHTLLRKKKK